MTRAAYPGHPEMGNHKGRRGIMGGIRVEPRYALGTLVVVDHALGTLEDHWDT